MGRRCFAVAAALCLAIGCSKVGGESRAGGGRSQAIAVDITSPQRITIQRDVDLAGTLVSPDEAKVSSEVAGVVRRVAVELGQEVQRGQILVELDSRELALALRRAESALKQTQAQLNIDADSSMVPADNEIASVRTAMANRDDARAQQTRTEELATRGIISPVDRENSLTRLKIAEAAYDAAIENVHSLKASLDDRQATYELARKKLDDATIRASVAGSVTERFVRPGEFIRENTPVVTLVQMDPLRLTTSVQERYAEQVRPGTGVQFHVESFPTQTFEGRVSFVSPSIDQSTRTLAIEADIANKEHRLRPGAFARGVIVTKMDENVLAVPDEAISTMAGVSNVYVVEKGKIRQQLVVVGEHVGRAFEIIEGLKGTEELAASNLSQLGTGVAVNRREAKREDAKDGTAGNTDDGGEADVRREP